MTAAAFRRALDQLGWSTRAHAAHELGVASEARISEWSTGGRKIPPYIAAHIVRALRLARVLETARLAGMRRVLRAAAREVAP